MTSGSSAVDPSRFHKNTFKRLLKSRGIRWQLSVTLHVSTRVKCSAARFEFGCARGVHVRREIRRPRQRADKNNFTLTPIRLKLPKRLRRIWQRGADAFRERKLTSSDLILLEAGRATARRTRYESKRVRFPRFGGTACRKPKLTFWLTAFREPGWASSTWSSPRRKSAVAHRKRRDSSYLRLVRFLVTFGRERAKGSDARFGRTCSGWVWRRDVKVFRKSKAREAKPSIFLRRGAGNGLQVERGTSQKL